MRRKILRACVLGLCSVVVCRGTSVGRGGAKRAPTPKNPMQQHIAAPHMVEPIWQFWIHFEPFWPFWSFWPFWNNCCHFGHFGHFGFILSHFCHFGQFGHFGFILSHFRHFGHFGHFGIMLSHLRTSRRILSKTPQNDQNDSKMTQMTKMTKMIQNDSKTRAKIAYVGGFPSWTKMRGKPSENRLSRGGSPPGWLLYSNHHSNRNSNRRNPRGFHSNHSNHRVY
jgi:hypothetical protein